MKTLTTTVLENVSGGASKSSELSTALSSIQSSIKDVASQKNTSGLGDSTTMLMLGLMMSQKNSSGPTVVAAGSAPAAAGPVVNISTRVRRGW